MDARPLKERLAEEARAAGFAAMGICRPDAIPEAMGRLQAFLAENRHGQMEWMADRAHWRGDPTALWPEARSVIMLVDSYAPEHDPLEVLAYPDRAAVSVYAQGKDYHDTIKPRLKRVLRWLLDQDPEAQGKVFVDTAPVMEKPLAQAAGLGWQGKHTNLVSREHGSWLFLGEIYTTLDLPMDLSEADHCGSCRACQDVCPTDAFPAPYRLDARRCISYLTIEHKGPIPEEFREAIGNRIYGCDDCLAVCPWNRFAQSAAANRAFLPRAELAAARLADLLALDNAGFREMFAGSPIKRIGRGRFIRNVLIAIGNSGDPELAPEALRLAGDPDSQVRGANALLAWAALAKRFHGHTARQSSQP